ncbi:MAG: SDR family oxidoreductase [Pyrinomonadaceae bacterium]
MRFSDKIAVITGGGSGIGRAVCERLASEGCNVVVVDINEEDGEMIAQIITAREQQAIFIKANVAKSDDVRAIVRRTIEKWAKIDILVNSAAIMTHKPITNLDEDDWDHLMAVNLRASFLLCKYCLPHMENGSIINISSIHGQRTDSNHIPYATSKAALEAFTRGLSCEYEPTKVRANCVAPGAVDTPLLWDNPNVKRGKEKIEGRIAKPEEIAAVIYFLASEEASYINGAVIAIDNGRLVKL